MAKRIWTHETVREEAKKYNTRNEFKNGKGAAHRYARENNIIDDVCSHMISGRGRWTKHSAHKEALKYTTKKEFELGSYGAYQYATRNKLINDICSHMGSVFIYWSNELAHKEALKYTTKNAFVKGSNGAYQYSLREDILDLVCSHMINGSGISDNNMVYVWRIPNTNIYKIGVSSLKLRDYRIKAVANKMGIDYEIVGMYEVDDAFEVEDELHNTYQIVPTTLPKKDGHTEFRILTESDVIEITYYLENVVGKKVVA